MSQSSSLQMKVQRVAGAIQGNRFISAITGGLMAAMPITIVGAIGSLINGLPIDFYQKFLVDTGLKAITAIPGNVTTSLFAIYAAYLIANKYAENEGVDGMPAGLLSIMAFLMVTPLTLTEKLGLDAVPAWWLDAKGLFTAMIMSMIVGAVYSLFVKKGWTIKMPAGVPPTVSKSFSAMVPGFVIAFIALALRYAFTFTAYGDMHSAVFGILTQPLSALGLNFWAMLLATMLVPILWFFGIHGALIVYSVFLPVWMPADQANLAAFNQGLPIPNVLGGSIFSLTLSAGSGLTIGLAIAMLFAKSQRYRTLGKLSIVPNICGINEPIIFGTPVVMNLQLLIPFIAVPAITFVSAYLLISGGILPRLTGVNPPLGTPLIISGLLRGGWAYMVFDIGVIVLSTLLYGFFFRSMDRQAFLEEQEAEAVEEVLENSDIEVDVKITPHQ